MNSMILIFSAFVVLISSLSVRAFKMPSVSSRAVRVPLRSTGALHMSNEKALFKKDLIDHLATKFELKKTLATKILNELVHVITEEVMFSGKEVRLQNFGTFKKSERGDRLGRNVKTGEPIDIAGFATLRFKPSPKMRVYPGDDPRSALSENESEAEEEDELLEEEE